MSEEPDQTPDMSPPDTRQPYLSAREAAETLGLNERTIRRAIERGALPASKRSGMWQIHRDGLDRWRHATNRRRPTPRTTPPLVLLDQAPARPPFAVPQPRSPLIGRERDIDAVSALLLDVRAPLVTLMGPGGSGKTRLALAVAASLRDRFADGIWFVDLSALRDAALVPGAIVQTLGLREIAGQQPIDRLRDYLKARITLLVLDNLEQVAPAANDVARLLDACPGLQVVATSRVPLRVSAEHRYMVAPLDLPAVDRPPDRDEVEAASATRLFRQAARRSRSDFEITDANAPAVAALCRRLDGLPLAIELAAAQLAVHTPQTLLQRLENRLAHLDHGPQDAPQRLRSMREAIGWSHDLLDERLRQRFRRLSVFDGGFTTEAAAMVTSQPPLDPASTEDHLRALVEANLVVADPESARFTLLETIREFGQDALEQRNELEALHEAHARWCHDLLDRAHSHWFTPTQTECGDVIEREHANLRAALTWLDASDHQEELIALTGLMWQFWFVRYHWLEGIGWLKRALAASSGQHTPARIRILTGAACLWTQREDEPRARAFGEESLALCHELGNVDPPDSPLNGLAICATMRGDFDEARRLNLESLAELRAHAGSVPSALPLVSVILCNMAWTHLNQGHPDDAESLALESLAISRELGFDWETTDTLRLLTRIAEGNGQHERATSHFRESLSLAVATRELNVIVANL